MSTETKKTNRPDFIAVNVVEHGEKKLYTDCGVAYQNKGGINILLSANPINGRLWLKPLKDAEEAPASE